MDGGTNNNWAKMGRATSLIVLLFGDRDAVGGNKIDTLSGNAKTSTSKMEPTSISESAQADENVGKLAMRLLDSTRSRASSI